MDRPTQSCSLCGRLIYWDHGFKKKNLRRHEYACATRTPEERIRACRVVVRRRKRARKDGDQLELSFRDDEPEEEA